MPQAFHTVDLPDGRSIDFPATMSDAEVTAALGKITGSPSQGPTPASTGPTEMGRINAEAEPWKKVSTLGGWVDQAKQVPGAIWQGLKNIPQGLAPGTGNPIETLFKIAAPSAVNVMKGAQDVKAGRTSEGTGRIAGGLLGGVGGNWLVSKGEQAGKGNILPAAAETATTMYAPKVAKGAVDVAPALNFWDSNRLVESAHAMLDKASSGAKRTLSDVRQNVSDHVGKLVRDIAAADLADKPAGNSIPISDIIPKLDEIANQYKTGGRPLPTFERLVGRIDSLPPNVSWYDLHLLRSDIGKAWDATSDGKDAAASNSLYREVTDKLSARAKGINRGEQFDSYNKAYSALSQYGGKGALGQLLNAPTGKDFFDTLSNPANSPQVRNLMADLEKYGLEKNFRKQLLDQHGELYSYAKAKSGGMTQSMGGKYRAFMKHPIAAGVAGTVGGAAGGWMGAAGSMIGAGALMDRLAAARQMSKLGGPPDITGNMGPRVEPVDPNAEIPKAPASAVDKGDLVSALKSLGYSKEAANAAAIQAIKEGPKDFDTALRAAMKKRGQ